MIFRVYQSSNDDWIVFDGQTKSVFSTESEAINMATKLTFATQMQIAITDLAQVADKLADLETVYFDRGYNSAGSDPVVDSEIASLGYTAANLTSTITLIQQLENFLGNSAVTTADYDATLNAVRSDV